MISQDEEKIKEILERSVEDAVVKEDLEKKLKEGKKLRIKFGIDPTGSVLHLGHSVPLWKLRQFQELGHQIILLIGDYTAMIGDPTGRNEARPPLTQEQIKENMKDYLRQAGKIIDVDRAEVRYNSEWYGKKGWDFVMELTGKMTVARILERDDFQKRLAAGNDILMQEMLYPLMQGYDSVVLRSDVEIGGTDQKFNLIMGRKLQKRYDQTEQDIITVDLLEGTDGEKKMSKSYGNFVGLEENPTEMYGKIMSLPDKLLLKYFRLTTNLSFEELDKIEKDFNSGVNPRDLKMSLANNIVRMYHGEKAEEEARNAFVKTFQSGDIPEDIKTIAPSAYDIMTVLTESGLCDSRSDARRQIEQGGVRINKKKIDSLSEQTKPGDVVQKGSRFFVKVG